MHSTWKKTTYFRSFHGNFLIPWEQRFCRTCVKNVVKCDTHLLFHFIDLVISNFDFDLVPPFYFLKWNRFFHFRLWKLVKFLMSFWKGHVSFPLNFVSIFSANLAHTLYTLFRRSPLKCNILRLLSALCPEQRFLMPFLKRQVNSSSNLS